MVPCTHDAIGLNFLLCTEGGDGSRRELLSSLDTHPVLTRTDYFKDVCEGMYSLPFLLMTNVLGGARRGCVI